jgi:hypothetical protein
MGKRGSFFNTVNFRAKLVYLLSFLMIYQVILEGGLNPLVFSVHSPLFPWENLRHIISRSSETSIINVLGISIHGLPL